MIRVLNLNWQEIQFEIFLFVDLKIAIDSCCDGTFWLLENCTTSFLHWCEWFCQCWRISKLFDLPWYGCQVKTLRLVSLFSTLDSSSGMYYVYLFWILHPTKYLVGYIIQKRMLPFQTKKRNIYLILTWL